jgi:hypothetical protein
MSSAARIAEALAGRKVAPHRGNYLVRCPAHKDDIPSLSLKDGTSRDIVVHCFAGCDARDVLDVLRRRGLLDHARSIRIPRHVEKWDLPAVEAEANEPCVWSEDEALRIAAARRIWDEARDPRGTLVERYLREERQLDLPEATAGPVLRFHPHCPWRNENTGRTDYVPALIVPFRSIDDDAITGAHRIALNSDGTKRDRRMLGVVRRAAIKLDPAGEMLCVGEGIESCMAARELGFTPVWALGSAGAISFLPVINSIKQLIILGEAGEASARAIKLCGTRWRKAGRRIRVVMPNEGLSDLNDALIAERTAS